jgi:hypothetical protein
MDSFPGLNACEAIQLEMYINTPVSMIYVGFEFPNALLLVSYGSAPFSFPSPFTLVCVPFYCLIYLDTSNKHARLVVPIWVSESEKAENIQTEGQDWLQDMQVSNI